ncbi:hypothetical protein BXY51_006908 [Actinoplanes cyaneus]|nr:hypothetical protein [Actinoplanes cyaneus]
MIECAFMAMRGHARARFAYTTLPKVVRRADARIEKRKLIMGSFRYLHGCGGTVNSCGGSR